MTTLINAIQVLAPVSALTTSTMILGFSYLQTPILIETTAKASPTLALRQIRAYFEQGKYIFPQMAMVSTGLFGYLAYAQPDKALGLGLAAAGCFSILPFTSLYMIPVTNNKILELDDKAKEGDKGVEKQRGEVQKLLGMFMRQNVVRGGMYWVGGVVGLATILA